MSTATAADATVISVEIPLSIAAGGGDVREEVTRYAADLVAAAGVPTRPAVALEYADSSAAHTVRVRVDGGVAVGSGIGVGDHRREDLVEQASTALFRARGQLVTAATAGRVAARLSGEVQPLETALLRLLRLVVRCGRALDRVSDDVLAAPQRERIESVLASCPPPSVTLRMGLGLYDRCFDAESGEAREIPDASHSMTGMLKLLQDGFFDELGLLFAVGASRDDRLDDRSFQVVFNDLPGPVGSTVVHDQVLVNLTHENLSASGIAGVAAVNPANGRSAALVSASDGRTLRDLGYSTWTPEEYAVLHAAGIIRDNADAFVDLGTLAFYLAQAREFVPDLVDAAEQRFDRVTLVKVLRALLREGVSVRDMPGILEALVAVNGVTTADTQRHIVLPPNGTHAVPVPRARRVGDLTPRELAESVRTARRRYVSATQTDNGYLAVILVDPDVETRVVDGPALDGAERERLLRSLRHELERAAKFDGRAALLTNVEARYRVRKITAPEYPHVPVLSFQELTGDTRLEPIGKVSL